MAPWERCSQAAGAYNGRHTTYEKAGNSLVQSLLSGMMSPSAALHHSLHNTPNLYSSSFSAVYKLLTDGLQGSAKGAAEGHAAPSLLSRDFKGDELYPLPLPFGLHWNPPKGGRRRSRC